VWDTDGVGPPPGQPRAHAEPEGAQGRGLGQRPTGAAEFGTLFHVTLHQLTTHPETQLADGVYVWENPAIYASCVPSSQDAAPGHCRASRAGRPSRPNSQKP
jgi:hypothetical protein